MALPGAAQADGEFYQFDYAPHGSSAVASVQRGGFGAALGWSEWEGGQAVSLYLNRRWAVPRLGDGTSFGLGPSVRLGMDGARDIGVRATLEHYRPTSWGAAYGLADLNSIAREYMVLGEVSHARSGLAGFVAFQGDRADFRERTVGVSLGLGESPVRLRLGHRLRAGRTFVGISVNTF